ncbi:MAG TPA: hypothetical protein DCY20_05295, partial [Firmicutes bacterium]|nr:hypothetical protein [Bacillota bacterium]
MKNTKKGITLVELIITMAVMSLLMATVTIVFSANSNILNKVDKKSELQLDAQMIQEVISTVVLECSGTAEGNFKEMIELVDADNKLLKHVFRVKDGEFIYDQILDNTVVGSKILSKRVVSFSV